MPLQALILIDVKMFHQERSHVRTPSLAAAVMGLPELLDPIRRDAMKSSRIVRYGVFSPFVRNDTNQCHNVTLR